MSNMCNASGASDPTAFLAMKNISKHKKPYMPRIYICASPRFNRENLSEFCSFAVRSGFSPFCTGLLYSGIESELASHMGRIYMDCCAQVWVFGDVSDLMKKEIARARSKSKPIRYFNAECKEVHGE